MSKQSPGNGERADDRQVYDGLVKDCRESGLSLKKAKEMSRQAMKEGEREAHRLNRR